MYMTHLQKLSAISFFGKENHHMALNLSLVFPLLIAVKQPKCDAPFLCLIISLAETGLDRRLDRMMRGLILMKNGKAFLISGENIYCILQHTVMPLS